MMYYFTVLWRENTKWKSFTIGSPTELHALASASTYAMVKNGIVIDKDGYIRWYSSTVEQWFHKP